MKYKFFVTCSFSNRSCFFSPVNFPCVHLFALDVYLVLLLYLQDLSIVNFEFDVLFLRVCLFYTQLNWRSRNSKLNIFLDIVLRLYINFYVLFCFVTLGWCLMIFFEILSLWLLSHTYFFLILQCPNYYFQISLSFLTGKGNQFAIKKTIIFKVYKMTSVNYAEQQLLIHKQTLCWYICTVLFVTTNIVSIDIIWRRITLNNGG